MAAMHARSVRNNIKEFEHLRHDASEQKILFEDMVLRTLSRMAMPTIAAIDAPALGGGLEIALACDLRVVRKGVSLGLTESRMGGLAGNGAVRVARLIGPARAKKCSSQVKPLPARPRLRGDLSTPSSSKAVRWRPHVDSHRPSQNGAYVESSRKALVDAAHDMPIDAALSMSTVAQQQVFDGNDLHEGVAAFLGKRVPEFSGR